MFFNPKPFQKRPVNHLSSLPRTTLGMRVESRPYSGIRLEGPGSTPDFRPLWLCLFGGIHALRHHDALNVRHRQSQLLSYNSSLKTDRNRFSVLQSHRSYPFTMPKKTAPDGRTVATRTFQPSVQAEEAIQLGLDLLPSTNASMLINKTLEMYLPRYIEDTLTHRKEATARRLTRLQAVLKKITLP